MNNYVIINGISSNTITGLLIQELPAISKPKIRTQIETIDGRDGDIVTKLGYSAYDKEMKIGLYGNFNIDQIIAFFNSEGTIIFSNEPDKKYNFQITEQIDFERLIKYKTAKVKIHVQPFKYSISENVVSEDIIDVNKGDNEELTIDNSIEALMKIMLKGNTSQEITTGKNLLNVNINSDTTNGLTYTVSDGNTITFNGQQTSGFNLTIGDCKLEAGHTYTISFEILSGSAIQYNNGNKQYLWNVTQYITGNPQIAIFSLDNLHVTFTPSESSTQIRFWAPYNASTTTHESFDNFKCRFWVEENSSATSFEPYTGEQASPNPNYPQDIKVVTGDNTINVCGKNLLETDNYEPTITKRGVTFTNNDDGTITVNGTNNESNYVLYYLTKEKWNYNSDLFALKEGTYTFSCTNSTYDCRLIFTIYYPNGTNYTFAITNNNSTTITFAEFVKFNIRLYVEAGATVNNVTLYPQIEKGSQKTIWKPYKRQTYPLYLGNIELCKIGTYQDYFYKSNNKWYLHKEIEKVVLDGSENWNNIYGTNLFNIQQFFTNNNAPTFANAMSNYFKYNPVQSNINPATVHGEFAIQVVSKSLFLKNTNYSTVNDFKSWLSSNNVIVYYVLETANNIEIIDTTLINQLNEIEKAYSYEAKTYITQENNEKPFILNITTRSNNKVTITNSGNTKSKPTIKLYGSGTINLYLNNYQIFAINLGDEEYIVLDCEKMEAYKDSILKNRLVTGNFDNFSLNVGENTIKWFGNVDRIEVSNYSRWL